MITSETPVGYACRDVLRAYALLTAGTAAVERALDHCNGAADAQMRMALTETSHATHQALVKLAEVMETLANLSQDPSHYPPGSQRKENVP